MAILSVISTYDFRALNQLGKKIPDLNGRYLALIGSRARNILRNKYLKGRNGGINLSKFPKDKYGRFTVRSDVNSRRNQVKIYSYPLNLFEKGRLLRSGSKEQGKFILTKHLKQDIMRGIGRYTNTFENKILQPELRKLGI